MCAIAARLRFADRARDVGVGYTRGRPLRRHNPQRLTRSARSSGADCVVFCASRLPCASQLSLVNFARTCPDDRNGLGGNRKSREVGCARAF